MKVKDNILYAGDYDKKFNFYSLGHFVINSLKHGGDREALVNGATGLSWTYADILEETNKYARSFFAFGIRRNDRIAIISENRHEVAAITFAAFCLNAIVSPINYTYTKRELQHALKLSQPKIVIVSETSAKTTIDVCKELKFVEKIILLDKITETYSSDDRVISVIDFNRQYELNSFFLNYVIAEQTDVDEQTAMIFLSSGTTDLSKGCETTGGNLFKVIDQYSSSLLNHKRFDERITTLNIAPWFHIMGFTNLFLILSSNRFRCIFLPKFDLSLFLSSIQKYKVSSMTIPPPVVILLAKNPLVDKFDLSSLKLILSGAAPLGRDIEVQIKTRFNNNIKLFTGYGLSEANIVVYNIAFDGRTLGSVGDLMKGMYAKVIDKQGKALGPNKIGELCFKGPLVMKGYFENPKATAETIDKDGYLHSGDLGYYDENFQFYVVDRLKELIKYKGFQVAPAELEGLLLSHPKIKDVGVIGIPDETAGELPFAFVVKQDGIELTAKEVKEFVEKNASNAKWLRGGVKFIPEIPKNPSGKILRRVLREYYKNMQAKL
ncbi:hypothetical protein PVAND_012859 [Polypedilum vanderplanki]|uniref:Uncharacterized protein n=1 Tax=Polypedilum vanderplanki TaxID=319348 RepID=A0A9J6CMS3_POLVA|nr:hypothetical protein PVAND_012859 [Polypedilum vanderplanki]